MTEGELPEVSNQARHVGSYTIGQLDDSINGWYIRGVLEKDKISPSTQELVDNLLICKATTADQCAACIAQGRAAKVGCVAPIKKP